MKSVRFLGNSLKCLRDFPEDAKQDAGYQIDKVQRGEQPDDFKPIKRKRKRLPSATLILPKSVSTNL